MAFRNGNRKEGMLLPKYIEDYVGENDSVRVYDKIIDRYSDEELGLEYDENQVGNSRYNPRTMLKLIAYSYSYGLRSSRKIERALYHNMSFVWLMGGLKPDHKTICNFRNDNEDLIARTLRLIVLECVRLKMVDGNMLFVDGTKVKANASLNKSWTKKKIKKHVEKIDKNIKDLLDEHKNNDIKEMGEDSYVKTNVKEKIEQLEKFKRKLDHIEDEIEKKEENEENENHNTTDTECVLVKEKKGFKAGYNGQITTDGKHGFIVSSEVVAKNNDYKQFSKQIKKGNENTGRKCRHAVADAGYYSIDQLKEIKKDDIDVIVPHRDQSREKKDILYKDKPFSHDKFEYDEKKDIYICPEGNELKYSRTYPRTGNRQYRIVDRRLCFNCKNYGECTESSIGRTILKNKDEIFRKELADRYSSDEGQAIYKHRKYRVEGVFGHLKHNMGYDNFLLRGIKGVNIEMNLFSIAHNIGKMINLAGIKTLLKIFS